MTPAERLAALLVAQNAMDDAMEKASRPTGDGKKTDGKGDGDA